MSQRSIPPPISISPPPPNHTPTNPFPTVQHNNNDLYIAPTMNALDTWIQYITAQHTYCKLLHIHEIHSIIQQYGFQYVQQYVTQLLNDSDSKVKEAMISEIGKLHIIDITLLDISSILNKNKQLQFNTKNRYIYQITVLLPYLCDSNDSIRDTTCQALIELCQQCNEVERQDLLRCILTLAHSESDAQRVTSIKLLHSMSLYLHSDLVNNFICTEIGVMSDDNAFRVRKATGQCFGNVAKIVGPTVTINKLLSHYNKLCSDLIWGVRRGCIDSIIQLTEVLPIEYKRSHMIPQMEKFLRDTSRWVRSGSGSILGHFIYVVGKECITAKLLQHYCEIPTINTVDPEVTYYCAYNLPAVLYTLGVEYWSQLKPCFHKLLNDNKFTVRNTISYSLHEIAAILGSELCVQDIIPALNTLINDISEVKFGVITNLSKILAILPYNERLQFVPIIHQLATQTENWRIRLLIAEQLQQLLQLYDVSLHTLVWILLRDNYSAVRLQATQAVGALIQIVLQQTNDNKQIDVTNDATSTKQIEKSEHKSFDMTDNTDNSNTNNDNNNTDTEMTPSIMSIEKPTLNDIQTELNSFVESTHYHDRQLFIHIAFYALPVLSEYFISHLNTLTTDSINNVRVTLAQQLIQYMHNNTGALHNTQLQQLYNKLQHDTNTDVQYIVETRQQSLSVNILQPTTPLSNTAMTNIQEKAVSPLRIKAPEIPAKPAYATHLLSSGTNENRHIRNDSLERMPTQTLVT